MAEVAQCPVCGQSLAADAPDALCPACLLKAGRESAATASQADEIRRFVPPEPAELARVFPQLEIIELIGKGGMGAVYKARQPSLDRVVALKILPPEVGQDAAFTERFGREARALARLNHPHIVAVYDFGQAEGLYYFVMEYVDGVNLRHMVAHHELAPQQALAIVPQLCEALQFAHDEGVVHRDIKPENILVDRRGRVKIADFGLAKLVGRPAAETSLTHVEQVMGTPHYMAPEQMATPREVDHRADIFSLGVVFYEMLTGELPLGRFAAPSAKVAVDVRLDEVVLRLLERDPERRYQQAGDVKTDVEHISHSSAEEPGSLRARVERIYVRGREQAAGLWCRAAAGGRQWPGAREAIVAKAAALRQTFATRREDLRLGYLSLAALATGIMLLSAGHPEFIETPIPWVLMLLAFCLSRAALAWLGEQSPTGAQKWLLYPALWAVYVPLVLVLTLWPIPVFIVATDALGDAAHHDPANFGWLQAAHPLALGFYLVTAGTMLWWSVLAWLVWWQPDWVSAVFHPFARDFEGRRGLWIGIVTLLVAIASTAGGARMFLRGGSAQTAAPPAETGVTRPDGGGFVEY